MYVYLNTDRGIWEVGFYSPKGKFVSESLWNNPKDASQRVNWLNGGTPPVLNIPTKITISEEVLADIPSRNPLLTVDESMMPPILTNERK